MADDYSIATASPRTVTLNGRDYRVGKLGPREVGDLQAWLKDQVPNPKEIARKMIEGLPDAVALEIWREATAEAKAWPPTLSSPEGQQLTTGTFEGQARCLWVALRKHNEGMDINAARELAEEISLEEFAKVMTLAGPEYADPKAGTRTGTKGKA